MKQVEKTYTSLTQWDFEATVTVAPESGGPVTQSVRTVGKGPIKRRVEMGDGASVKFVIVADGENLWAYPTQPNQYTKKALTQERGGKLSDFEAILFAFRAASENAADAKLVREEPIAIGSTKTDCYVIEFGQERPPSVVTWWVDKRRFVVLRDYQAGGADPSLVGVSTIWTRAQIDGIPDNLFIFTPPPGAKEQTAP